MEINAIVNQCDTTMRGWGSVIGNLPSLNHLDKALLDAATLCRVATVSLTGNTHTVMPSGFTVYR